MIRWTSPVRHFMRTAQADTEIAGTPIAKGDWVYLSYLAANRDRRSSRIRTASTSGGPTPTAIWRSGSARTSASAPSSPAWSCARCFRDLVPRLEQVELAGTPTTMKTTFVGGPKSLPIRYRLRPAG